MSTAVVALFIFIFLASCSDNQDTEPTHELNNAEQVTDSKWVAKAKSLTTQHKLTALAIECLAFEEDKAVNGKKEITVREVHNDKCGGDPGTAPRVFSFEVDIATEEFKTDRYSLNAEFESFDKLSKEDGL